MCCLTQFNLFIALRMICGGDIDRKIYRFIKIIKIYKNIRFYLLITDGNYIFDNNFEFGLIQMATNRAI